MIGKTISHYKITEELGRGGMGVVYKAWDTTLEREVALKFLPVEFTRDESARKRFIVEARAAAALDHTNICAVYDVGEADGHTFIVMRYIEGESLRDRLASDSVSLRDALDITAQIGRGLSEAHKNGIFHRDIKPANILLTKDRVAKVVDFGLAKLSGKTKLTRSGTAVGTAAYMSPEQAKGEEVDGRTDVWSLGVVFYELLTGRNPFDTDADHATLYSIINLAPEPVTVLNPDIPLEVERVVSRALEKDVSKRYRSIDEFLRDIEDLQGRVDLLDRAHPVRRWFSHNKRRIVFGVVAVAAIGALSLAAYQFWPGHAYAIAVLPFENISGDPDREYYVDGLTDGLITDLAMIGSVSVISRTSILPYKKDPKPVREVGDELNVDAVVEATVNWIDERVHVTAHLVDCRRETHIWSQTFEREMHDVLNLQSEIAREIASTINATISADVEEYLGRSREVNLKAYQQYRLGQHWWDMETPGSLDKAIECFEAAIAIDSEFAAAWAGLAHCYIVMGCHSMARPHDVYPKARQALIKALDIDERCAEAHVALAHMVWEYDWDLKRFQVEIERALELNPSCATAYHFRAAADLITWGRCEIGGEWLAKAAELDPLSVRINADLVLPMVCAERYEEARQQIRMVQDVFPNWDPSPILAAICMHEGSYDKAITLLETQDRQLYSDIHNSMLGYCYAKGNRSGETQAIVQKMEEKYSSDYTSAYLIATLHAALGEADKTFEWLELAYENRDPLMTRLKIDGRLDNVREDSRFHDLIARVGLE